MRRALKNYVQALSLLGNQPDLIEGRALARAWAGGQLLQVARPEDAVYPLQHALHPRSGNTFRPLDVARWQGNLASALRGVGRWEEAEAAYRAALDALERAPREAPSDEGLIQAQAALLARLAGLLAHEEVDRFPEAERALAEARAVLTGSSSEPSLAHVEADAAEGKLLERRGRFAEAAAAYRKAADGSARLVEQQPGVATYREVHAVRLYQLARCLAREGDNPEVPALLAEALRLQGELAAKQSHVHSHRFNMSQMYWTLAEYHKRAGRKAEAARAYQEAAHLRRAVVKQWADYLAYAGGFGQAVLGLAEVSEPGPDLTALLAEGIAAVRPWAKGPLVLNDDGTAVSHEPWRRGDSRAEQVKKLLAALEKAEKGAGNRE